MNKNEFKAQVLKFGKFGSLAGNKNRGMEQKLQIDVDLNNYD